MSAEPVDISSRRSAPAPAEQTDLANARRFAIENKDELRYVPGLGWLVWDGFRFALDETKTRYQKARETVARMTADAVRRDDKAAQRHAIDSANMRRFAAMLKLAEAEPQIVMLASRLDREPTFINCLDGLIDLRTGECRPTAPSDNVTLLAPSFYRPGAQCPAFLTFLDQVMGHDAEMVDYLQRVLGYSATGLTHEHALWIFYGLGANGKTTLMETVADVLGDFAAAADPSTFLRQRGEGARPDLVALRGRRLVRAAETEGGRALAEGLVKSLTGGDAITARPLYQSPITFEPAFKIVMSTNSKPRISGADHGIWRRVRLAPFAVRFEGKNRDLSLRDKLRAERVGVFAWLVAGARYWFERGLDDPPQVLAATEAYRTEQDLVEQFIEDRCERDPQARGMGLYPAFSVWAEANGLRPVSAREFKSRLEARGFESKRASSGRYFQGIKLLSVSE